MNTANNIQHLNSCFALELDTDIAEAVEEIARQYGIAKRAVGNGARSKDEERTGIYAVRALQAAREDLARAQVRQRI